MGLLKPGLRISELLTDRGTNFYHAGAVGAFLFIYFEAEREGEETSMCGCLWRAPYWGPGQQHRHVP